MCVKAPKPAPKTAEELAMEEEARAARLQRKRELADMATREKDKRFEEAVARSRGQWGARSLISGPKGGAGFLFGGGRSGLPLIPAASGGSGGGGVPISGGGGGGGDFTGTMPSLIGGFSGGGAGGGFFGGSTRLNNVQLV